MTTIMDYLPWLEGWKYQYQPPISYVIPAGQFQQTYDSKITWQDDVDGYILGLGACSDQPTTTLEIFHSGPKNIQRLITGTAFALNAMGVQYPNASGFWYGTYNANIPLYCAFYHPPNRLGTFIDYLRIRIVAPAANPSVVSTYWHLLIEVFDRKAWRKSMRKLFQSDVFKLKTALPEETPKPEGKA